MKALVRHRASTMGYVPVGDVATYEFNASKYPGVSKPSTFQALATFKELQNQLNRVAYVTKNTLLTVDGDIGAGTVQLYAKVKSQLVAFADASSSWRNTASIDAVSKITAASTNVTIATYADVIASVAKAYANSMKAPASVAAPKPAKLPTLVSATGAEIAVSPQQELMAKLFGRPLSTTEMLALLAVGGGVGYLLLTRKKRGRR